MPIPESRPGHQLLRNRVIAALDLTAGIAIQWLQRIRNLGTVDLARIWYQSEVSTRQVIRDNFRNLCLEYSG